MFLRKPLLLDAQVGYPDGEAVLDAAEQVDLVRYAGLGEDIFRLVPFFGGEYLVRFCVRNFLSALSQFHRARETEGRDGAADYSRAAAMLKGPLMVFNSSASTKLGCATNPASSLPSFRFRTTYLAPKQYPTPPNLLTPIFPLISLITASTTGSTRSGWWPFSHSRRSKPSGLFSINTGSPWNRSGITTRYPFAASWSAISWALMAPWPMTSVRRRMAFSVLLSLG